MTNSNLNKIYNSMHFECLLERGSPHAKGCRKHKGGENRVRGELNFAPTHTYTLIICRLSAPWPRRPLCAAGVFCCFLHDQCWQCARRRHDTIKSTQSEALAMVLGWRAGTRHGYPRARETINHFSF